MYIHKISDTRRIVVEQDMFPEDPRTWNNDEQVLVVNDYRRWAFWETPEVPRNFIEEVYVHTFDSTSNDRLALRAAKLAAVLIGENPEDVGILYEPTHDRSGWLDILYHGEYGLSKAKVYAMWARGDVFHVEVQEISTCDHGEQHYDTVDDLFGIYADDEEEAANYYIKEYI